MRRWPHQKWNQLPPWSWLLAPRAVRPQILVIKLPCVCYFVMKPGQVNIVVYLFNTCAFQDIHSISEAEVSFFQMEQFIISCSMYGEHHGSFPKQCLPKQQNWGSFKLREHAYSWGGLNRGELSMKLGKGQQSLSFRWSPVGGSLNTLESKSKNYSDNSSKSPAGELQQSLVMMGL